MELIRYWSSGEDESSEEESNINGRWYECVYCKRGFTTAQALGGHMNIHRKDRAKPKPKSPSTATNITSTSTNNNHVGLSFYYSPIIHPPPSASTTHHHHPTTHATTSPSSSHVFGDDWRSFYSNNNNHPFCVPLPPIHHNSQHDALDLELRLGYHP